MKENKKNVITIIVAVMLLLVFVIGLTYALFTFAGKGERINQISTTSVTMSYSEAQNGIILTNAMPISDAAGIVLNDSNQTFEFTVSVATGSGVPVAWEVSAERLTGSTLSNDKVRIYLEKKESNAVNYTAVSDPSNFIPESNASVIGTPSGEMILDQDSATTSVTYNYKLRMWVSESYELDETEKTFSVKINVYGKDNYKSATGISLNKNSTTITVGDTENLTATVTPTDAYNGDITWSSSNTSVATVNSSGVVTAVGVGSVAIIARTKNGKSATCTVIVNNIPDGSTVTPVNDIETWLKCAGITDKSYTTISQVLNDQATLSTLVNDDNANDYLVRSTSWTSSVSGNQIAMNYIGQNNYSADTLLDNSTWRTAIANSTYFESVLNDKIPVMTSNTTPNGEAFASSSVGASRVPYKAFCGNGNYANDNCWAPAWTGDSTYSYLGYQFTNNVKPVKLEIKAFTNNAPQNITIALQVGTNKTNWNTVKTFQHYVSLYNDSDGEVEQTATIVDSYDEGNTVRIYDPIGVRWATAYQLVVGVTKLQIYCRKNI